MASRERKITAAHRQATTETIVRFYPDHEPRSRDPHYKYFTAARKKLKEAGKLVCWVCGKADGDPTNPIEVHHTWVEFATQNGYDWQKFAAEYPAFLIDDQESFFLFVESNEQNMTCLCAEHHTGIHGIHHLDGPTFNAMKYWKVGLPAPGEVVPTPHAAPPPSDDKEPSS